MSNYQKVQKLLGPWSPALALKQRVEREAEAEWALQASEPFQVIPPMVVEAWEWPSAFALISKILP